MLNSGRPPVQPQGLASAGRTAEASAREREFQRKAEWVVAAEDEARRGDVAERGVGGAAAWVGAKRTAMCSCSLEILREKSNFR